MIYMVFDLIVEKFSAKIQTVRFMKSDSTISKLRDELYNERRYEYVNDKSRREKLVKFDKDAWRIRAYGYSFGENEHVFIAKQGDDIWNMIVSHVDDSGRVPVNVSRQFMDFIKR